jgi:hypothetical protein
MAGLFQPLREVVQTLDEQPGVRLLTRIRE